MRDMKKSRGSGRLGCILWLAVLGLIGYGLYKVIPVKVATSTFYDFMQEEASFASIRNVKQLEKEILAKAKELNIPVTEENLIIRRSRESITIEAHYEITIEFFRGWKKYVWKFDQVVERPTFLV
jgi:type III secretion system FlhB-like substrate exporter